MTTSPQPTSTRRCPVAHASPEASERKSTQPHDALFPLIEVDRSGKGERWTLRSLTHVRSILRDPEATQQAGFGAEIAARGGGKMRPPILYLEGEAHKAQRTATARFFTPQTVSRDYREMMERLSSELVEELRQKGQADLSKLAMRLAVQVAGRVIGLTNSSMTGMSRRLNTFFEDDPTAFSLRPDKLWRFLMTQSAMWQFFYLDVKPAIRARRREPQDDLISHLLDKGYSDFEILTECVTYAAAGMVTTREFLSMATWHFLDNPPLRERYLIAGEKERQAILHEILRLEPIVGHLYRRTRKPLTVEHGGETLTIPAGSLLDLDLRAANADAKAVGEQPLSVCPGRELPKGVQGPVLSFGDGHHRCPGAYIAMQESDIFLTRLLQLPLVLEKEPEMTWNDLVAGYDLRSFVVRTS